MLPEIVRQQLEATIDAHAILSATDVTGNILYVNNHFIEISGYREDELLGQNHRLVRSTLHNGAFYQDLWQTVTSGKTWHGDICNQHKSGSLYWVRATIMPIMNAHNEITHYVSIRTDITELIETKQRLHQVASTDALTRLANRAEFNRLLSEALSECQHQQTSLAILFFDIDNFKQVNDSLGHSVGDQLLSSVSQCIDACLPNKCLFARWGGDEFIILLPNTCDQQTIQQIAKRVLTSIQHPIFINDQPLFVTLSMGAACYPNDACNLEELLSSADMAMYYAKSHGRNQLCFYADIDNIADKVKQLSLQNKLIHALKTQQIQIHFQPIINCQTNTVEGVETLARWYDSEEGWISPEIFIALAENIGMIGLLSEQVLTQSFAVLSHWLAAGLRVNMAVNLSGIQLYSSDLVTHLMKLLDHNGLPPERITLEITESAAMRNIHHALEQLRALKNLGFGVAIDDFGTGYSSLSQLQHINADKLKIDRSFIHQIEERSGLNLVKAIANMAQSLGIRTIAEGVETEAQRTLVNAVGIDAIQGYLYARPMPATTCEAWITAYNAKSDVQHTVKKPESLT